MPKIYKEGFKKEITARILYVVAVMIFMWALIFGITMSSAAIFLYIQNESLENNIDSMSSLREAEEAQELEDEIEEVNATLRRISNIKQENPYDALEVIMHTTSLIPEGARLGSLNFTPDSGRILITGRSDSRVIVRRLESNLENDPLFSDIEHPLSNLIQTNAGDFEFRFTITLASEDDDE
ncbi:MAG: PilN domain-containing protein [Candidatus Spechtbacterales bacterium]